MNETEDSVNEHEDKEYTLRMSIMLVMFTVLVICFITIAFSNLKSRAKPDNSYEIEHFEMIDEYYDKEAKMTFGIFYDKSTLVKYAVVKDDADNIDMTPLYNADGTLQLYDDINAKAEE